MVVWCSAVFGYDHVYEPLLSYIDASFFLYEIHI
jgi:hypothetical protein